MCHYFTMAENTHAQGASITSYNDYALDDCKSACVAEDQCVAIDYE